MQTYRANAVVSCALTVAVVLAARYTSGADTNAPAGSSTLTLGRAIELAMENNPALAAARLRSSAARNRPVREGALPNLVVTVSAEDRASDFRVAGANTTKFDIEQPVPWFGKLALRRNMAETDAETARLNEESQKLDLKVRVTEAAYGLDAARRGVVLVRGEVDLLRQLEAVTRTKYATGATDQQDVDKAQAEVTMMQQRLIDARGRVTSLKARLNTLMGFNADADPGDVIVPPPSTQPQVDLTNWLARAESDNPEIGKARVMAVRSRLEERLMRREFFPDLKIVAEVTRDRGGDETFVMLGLGVDLPLRVAANRAGLREANDMSRAADAEREAMLRETEYMIQDIASCCASAWQNLELLRTQLLPQADARYKASESAYAAGKGDFLDLLESQRFRLSVRLMAVMTEADAAIQLARLERLLGGPVAKSAAEGKR